MGLKWSDQCCICGRAETSYHNPEPLRDGMQDCCSRCNQLVINARIKCSKLSEEERAAYILRLRGMTYEQIVDELGEK